MSQRRTSHRLRRAGPIDSFETLPFLRPMHPRLTELDHYADAQRAALLAATAALPDARWSERPAPDVWAVSDVCEHLHRVERGCARLIAPRAAEAHAANHRPETSTSTVLDRLDAARITDRSTPVQAPDRVAPAGGWIRSAALDALARSRAELHAAMQAADGSSRSTRHGTSRRSRRSSPGSARRGPTPAARNPSSSGDTRS